MRPVNRGLCPKDADGNEIRFANYRAARDDLIRRIGDYCSYCKVCLHGPIDVEHVQPKGIQPALALTWTNFLLSCTTCNSIKQARAINLADYFWPDRDNTALIFDYDLDEPPKISVRLDATLRPVAERTLALTGLDRVPGHPSYSGRDRRWFKRREAWGLALEARRILERIDNPEMRDQIMQTAISRGFWSVWFQVFHDDQDMRSRLLRWFPGTATDCFDHGSLPVTRRGGLI